MSTVAVVYEIRSHITESFRAKSTEWISTIGALLGGYSLAQPTDTFGLSSSYATMRALVSSVGLTEDQVGVSIVLLAVFRMCVLAYNGLWTSSPIARMWMSVAYAFFWFLIATGFYTANGWGSLGTAFVATFVIGEMINVLRTSNEVGRRKVLVRGRQANGSNSGN